MKKSSRPLRLDRLEDRTVPTLFGVPWADPTHLTLSFAPDGTSVPGGGASTLFQSLNAVAPTAVWEGEIVRAFQSWAANSNINIAVVPDSGDPLGTPGAVQGDARFGDIRIAESPLSGQGQVATASPFSWTGSTFSGDVVLNPQFAFAIGNVPGQYDLASVMMHEAGHVFGLDHNPSDPNSVMGESYSYHVAPDATDIQNLQALYATRTIDAFDQSNPNTTFASATSLSAGSGTRIAANADITTATDTDFYKIAVPKSGTATVSFRVKATGISLLTPSLTVYSAGQTQVGMAATTDPLNNTVTYTLTNPTAGATYYVRVGSTRSDAFGIGAYNLTIDFLAAGAQPPADAPTTFKPIADNHTDDTIDTAMKLKANETQVDPRFDATYQGVISDTTDSDVYRIDVPKALKKANGVTMVAMVWALDPNGLNPRIHVFDDGGNPLAFQVLSNDAGIMSVQVAGMDGVKRVYIQVTAGDTTDLAHNCGNYFLGVDFNQLPAMSFDGVTSNTLTSTGPQDTGNLMVANGALMEFALAANAGTSTTTSVTMTIFDANGNIVGTLTAKAGQPSATKAIYMAAGTYTVKYAASTTSGTLPATTYSLYTTVLSDGIGPRVTSTSTSGAGVAPPHYTYSGTSTTVPAGTPYWF